MFNTPTWHGKGKEVKLRSKVKEKEKGFLS